MVVAIAVLFAGCIVDFGIGTGGRDAQPLDGAAQDSALPDGALPDGGPVDAAPPDAGSPDAGQMDAAVTCGDGVLDVNEQCDDGVNNSDTAPNACRNNCRLPWCGDGVVDTNEACDDGVANSNVTPDACRTTCVLPGCGDSIEDSGEQCDDGNTVNSDACRNTCQNATCGDSVVWIGQEQCDDGNTTSGDGCSSTCSEENLPELRWLTTTAAGWSTPWVITYAGEPYAPTTSIRAAVAIEPEGRVILFTQTTYHVLRIPQLTWYDSGTLAADFDALPSAGPHAGYGLAGTGTSSSISLMSGHIAYLYDYTHIGGNVTFVQTDDINGISGWQTATAPDPTQLVSMYLDLSNDHGWVNDTLVTACGSGVGDVVGYSVSLTSSLLHLLEIGNCFDFYDQMSYSAFAPFASSVSGRPALSEIRGTFYYDTTDTLYVVTQQ